MTYYTDYLEEISARKKQGLHAKPIDNLSLMEEIIQQIKDDNNVYRKDSLHYFIYNTLPGTTGAASAKAGFLKDIALNKYELKEISSKFALELLSHMKGGPSVKVLLDIALEHSGETALEAAEVLKTQVFLYEADMERLANGYHKGNEIARDILESYSNAEFFTKLPDIDEEIKGVSLVAAEGDISRDLLSPGTQAQSRSERE
ncbi:MAG: hypothetical protein VW930_06445, partial [Burkholderiaceae bacterium]